MPPIAHYLYDVVQLSKIWQVHVKDIIGSLWNVYDMMRGWMQVLIPKGGKYGKF
jgi:hypothetical protein